MTSPLSTGYIDLREKRKGLDYKLSSQPIRDSEFNELVSDMATSLTKLNFDSLTEKFDSSVFDETQRKLQLELLLRNFGKMTGKAEKIERFLTQVADPASRFRVLILLVQETRNAISRHIPKLHSLLDTGQYKSTDEKIKTLYARISWICDVISYVDDSRIPKSHLRFLHLANQIWSGKEKVVVQPKEMIAVIEIWIMQGKHKSQHEQEREGFLRQIKEFYGASKNGYSDLTVDSKNELNKLLDNNLGDRDKQVIFSMAQNRKNECLNWWERLFSKDYKKTKDINDLLFKSPVEKLLGESYVRTLNALDLRSQVRDKLKGSAVDCQRSAVIHEPAVSGQERSRSTTDDLGGWNKVTHHSLSGLLKTKTLLIGSWSSLETPSTATTTVSGSQQVSSGRRPSI